MANHAGGRLPFIGTAVLLAVTVAACSSQPEAPPQPAASRAPTGAQSVPSVTPVPTETQRVPPVTPGPAGSKSVPSAAASASPRVGSAGPGTGSPAPKEKSAAPRRTSPAPTTKPTPSGPGGPPPATTAVPQQSPGDVNTTVPVTPEPSRRPVALDSPAATGSGLTASVTRLRGITAEAKGPGEVSGPAVALTVAVENGSNRPVDLGAAVVKLEDSAGAPGSEILSPPAKPLAGRLRPGEKTRSGTYVFRVAKDRRDPITVQVSLGSGLPVLVFTGDAG